MHAFHGSDERRTAIDKNNSKPKQRKKAGFLWILLGILLLAGAGGLSLYNVIDGMRAAKASEIIAESLAERIATNAGTLAGKWNQTSASSGQGTDAQGADDQGTDAQGTNDQTDSAAGSAQGTNFDERYLTASDEAALKYRNGVSISTAEAFEEMPTEIIDGESYIGILEIPSLDLILPVMENWDYDRLKISPCRYSGSYYSDDLVICAHNYARHFSPIKWINLGEDVYFTNVNGVRLHYKTSNIETVQPTQVDLMIGTDSNASSGDNWDLTLFTCNTGGQTRCAVRCVRDKSRE